MAAPPPPNQTLYVKNLNDKIRKPDLRISLYTLFATYGVVLDVVALKTPKHRGQAHIAFRDVASATQAMRALQGFNIFGKEMKISYARGKSHTIAKLDGTFRIPDHHRPEDATPFVPLPGAEKQSPAAEAKSPGEAKPAEAKPAAEAVTGEKRQRDEEEEAEGSEEEAEMEVDDDD